MLIRNYMVEPISLIGNDGSVTTIAPDPAGPAWVRRALVGIALPYRLPVQEVCYYTWSKVENYPLRVRDTVCIVNEDVFAAICAEAPLRLDVFTPDKFFCYSNSRTYPSSTILGVKTLIGAR